MIKQHYEISSSNGVIYATPATADWTIKVMENAIEVDYLAYQMALNAMNEDQIEIDQFIFALMQVGTQIQQIH